LPLLRHARFVSVEIVEGHSRHAAAAATPAGIDVAAYLERHGVRASFSAIPHTLGVNVGTTLLNRASDLHADLLVTGAYAHSKAHERVLGGVTRTLLESMTVPVLMSH